MSVPVLFPYYLFAFFQFNAVWPSTSPCAAPKRQEKSPIYYAAFLSVYLPHYKCLFYSCESLLILLASWMTQIVKCELLWLLKEKTFMACANVKTRNSIFHKKISAYCRCHRKTFKFLRWGIIIISITCKMADIENKWYRAVFH